MTLPATIHYKLELVGTAGTSLILNITYNNVPLPPVTMCQNGDPFWDDSTWLSAFFYYKAGCYYPHKDTEAPLAGTAKVTFSSLSATP